MLSFSSMIKIYKNCSAEALNCCLKVKTQIQAFADQRHHQGWKYSARAVEGVKDITCLRRNAVYPLTCNSCDQQYIGSTTRFMHDRVREHINNENSSVKKHTYSCQNYKGIDGKITMSENDPANLRLYKAFYIRK